MAHPGVVAHTSSWTPAAYEPEESAPWNSDVGGLPVLPVGRREQGDKVENFLMGLTAGNAAGYRGGAINTGIEDFLVLPAVPVVPLLPGPALRDGFSHVLGLRIVVPEAAPLWLAVAATIFRILARRLFEWLAVWDVATCSLGLIIYPSHAQACSFRPPMSMTACASGVRGLHRRRQTRGPQVLTLRRLPMSEFAKRKFRELSKDPGSASRLSEPQFSELKMKVSDHHGSFFALSARGDFGGEPRGSTPKLVFPMLARPSGFRILGSSSQSLHPLAPSLSPSSWYSVL